MAGLRFPVPERVRWSMNRNSGRTGWFWRWLEWLGGLGPPPRTGNSARRPEDDDEDEGLGVPVPVGPHPRRGGAQARPPGEREPARR
ncbi:hypothetical protein Dalu01_00728 [Deinococcus aluminii]|uniref:Uncharacterized protein n=2 Tax=Deinococcus aluminii TaxID=1656885 RepID=A0ABP9XAF9_9DEIO